MASKKRILADVCDLADSLYRIGTKDPLSALVERERLGSTAVGNGIAIPHARLCELERVYGFFTRLDHPIEFESLDYRPVDLIFTILAPKTDGAEHLKALAAVSRVLRSDSVCAKLRANSDPKTLYSILTHGAETRAA